MNTPVRHFSFRADILNTSRLNDLCSEIFYLDIKCTPNKLGIYQQLVSTTKYFELSFDRKS